MSGAIEPLSDEKLAETLRLLAQHPNQAQAALAAGISASTFKHRVKQARKRFGISELAPHAVEPQEKPRIRVKAGSSAAIKPERLEVMPERVARVLRRTPLPIDTLAAQFGTTTGHMGAILDDLAAQGLRIERRVDGAVMINIAPPAAFMGGPVYEYVSRPDNTFVFGAAGDQHLGSKYSRLDVLNSLYDMFAEAEVDRVFNTGNWIDGEARFNTNDLLIHGMDAQCRYLAREFPNRAGIVTYAVAGDDHEGWYAQREGVDIGRYAERCFEDSGRSDWVNLGYMEAHVRLVNANTGATSIMAVVHPGGGSAYALSYSIQKIVESLEGGEKPAVGLYGHYHKLWAGNIRNVWCVQTGTSQDQTPFMRKKKLSAHIGGAIVKLTQDPETGAITRCAPELVRFFNRGFYNDRWSHAGPVVQPARTMGAA